MKTLTTVVWGGSVMSTLGVKDGTLLQLETSPLRMMIIGTNFRGDKITMGEMILDSIGYSLIWVVDEEKAGVGWRVTLNREKLTMDVMLMRRIMNARAARLKDLCSAAAQA